MRLTDAETGPKVVQDGKDGRLELQVDPVRRDQADQGDKDDEGGVEPVDVLVPVADRDGLLGDVWGGGGTGQHMRVLCFAAKVWVTQLLRRRDHSRGLRMS